MKIWVMKNLYSFLRETARSEYIPDRESMGDSMDSILIKDTTKEERERIVAESIGNIDGACDGCAAGLAEMYRDYIDGKREIRDINMEFSASKRETPAIE